MPPVIRGFALTPRRLLALAGVVALAVAMIWFRDQLDLKSLHDHAHELNGGLVFLGLTFLPLLGFPVSVMHALAGAKFGLVLGGLLVGASIAIQICASYGIVRLFPRFFAHRFEWLRRRLPAGTHRSLTLFTMLLPGAPYFAQIYTLPLVGVPFRMALGYGLSLNFARSFAGIIFGEWSGAMTPPRIAIFVGYTAAITLACGLAFRRLRAQLRNRRPRGNGRTRSARYDHAAR